MNYAVTITKEEPETGPTTDIEIEADDLEEATVKAVAFAKTLAGETVGIEVYHADEEEDEGLP